MFHGYLIISYYFLFIYIYIDLLFLMVFSVSLKVFIEFIVPHLPGEGC